MAAASAVMRFFVSFQCLLNQNSISHEHNFANIHVRPEVDLHAAAWLVGSQGRQAAAPCLQAIGSYQGLANCLLTYRPVESPAPVHKFVCEHESILFFRILLHFHYNAFKIVLTILCTG